MTLTAALMKRGWAITCISLSLGCGGFAWAGFSINHLDIAPQVIFYRILMIVLARILLMIIKYQLMTIQLNNYSMQLF